MKTCLNIDLLLYRLPYQNEISAVIHDILRDWRVQGQFCALFKPVSSTNQGRISDVSIVSKRPQRNAWWICGYLRAQAEIFPSYLHRPGSNQQSHSCFRVYCMVWLGPASRRRSWMTTTVPSYAAEVERRRRRRVMKEVEESWILTNSSLKRVIKINLVDEQTSLTSHTPCWKI